MVCLHKWLLNVGWVAVSLFVLKESRVEAFVSGGVGRRLAGSRGRRCDVNKRNGVMELNMVTGKTAVALGAAAISWGQTVEWETMRGGGSPGDRALSPKRLKDALFTPVKGTCGFAPVFLLLLGMTAPAAPLASATIGIGYCIGSALYKQLFRGILRAEQHQARTFYIAAVANLLAMAMLGCIAMYNGLQGIVTQLF